MKSMISTNGQMLILPLWSRTPLRYEEGRDDHINFVKSPAFTSADNLGKAYKRLPRPVNVGLETVTAEFGKDVALDGIYLLSQSGDIAWLQPSGPSWDYTKTCTLSESWKTNLIRQIRSEKVIRIRPNDKATFWGAVETGIKHEIPYSLSLSTKERRRICAFLQDISTSNTNDTEWKTIQ